MKDFAYIKPYALVGAGHWFFRTAFSDEGPKNTYWLKSVYDDTVSINLLTGESRVFNDTEIVGEIVDIGILFR